MLPAVRSVLRFAAGAALASCGCERLPPAPVVDVPSHPIDRASPAAASNDAHDRALPAASTARHDAMAREAGASSAPNGRLAPMPLISRGLAAFTNHALSPAAAAFDADYATSWRSGHEPSPADPDWIAVDLSTVPAEQRDKVYSVWFNEGQYDYDASDAQSYTLPGDYQIQSNAAPGGRPPPSSGWVTLASAAGNFLSSGAHIFRLAGANWLRFVSTASAKNVAVYNKDTSLQWEIYDARAAVDAWKFAGDSITANAMGHKKTNDAFNQLVEKKASRFPAFEMAGHAFWSSATMLDSIDAYLANFPGHFFGLAFGTNDPGANPSIYGANMSRLIDKVLSSGKVPVIPTIPYTGEPGHVHVVEVLNVEVNRLLSEYGPKLVRGPDLYKILYEGRARLFDQPTDLHPNELGNLAIRQAWADAMVAEVYREETEGRP